MAIKQTDGTSSVTSSSSVNSGGTVLNGGNITSDSPFTKNISINENADGGTDYGSKVDKKAGEASSSDHNGRIEAKGLGNGTFAFYPNAQEGERNFILRNAGTADGNNKINNSVEASLATPGSDYASVGIRTVNKIHKIVDTDKYGSAATTEYNVLARPSSSMVPGRTKGTGAGADQNFVQSSGSVPAVDDAASPTRGVPGELTYHFGGLAKPSTDEYKAKDDHEPS